ncbi:MAG: hypothetical protein AAF806_29430 [Bacteroidota bacterium]
MITTTNWKDIINKYTQDLCINEEMDLTVPYLIDDYVFASDRKNLIRLSTRADLEDILIDTSPKKTPSFQSVFSKISGAKKWNYIT